ncbi:phage scaffolding protein [Cohnella mopanensis]|uniref:phage scaffolding protein n=1 Tax=Cohnella mopanensis TaxID=2911966 RepID=UPI001EF85996|nr:scaffolding protein [Cohnella mopanensis]
MKRFINALYGYTPSTPMFEADDGSGGGGSNDDGDEESTDKRTVTMTQAELDALIGREKGRATKKYADYDDLKAERDRLRAEEEARKQAELTDKERADAEKTEALQRAADAEAASAKTIEAANQRLIKAEFRAVARELNVRPDALDDALKLADLTAVTVDEEGNVVGVKNAVQALITNKPYLVEKTKPRNIGGGGTEDQQKPDKTKEQLLAEAAEKARKSGRIEDRIAYADLKEELSK